jgi:hypothetical protein
MNFLAELKRRNVYKVAVAYAVVGLNRYKVGERRPEFGSHFNCEPTRFAPLMIFR